MLSLPRFAQRSPRELRKALLWAQQCFYLRDWVINLRFGKVDLEEQGDGYNPASTLFILDLRHAAISLDKHACEQVDLDPVFCLFHEVAHIFLAGLVDNQLPGFLIEQAVNVLAELAFELWSAK